MGRRGQFASWEPSAVATFVRQRLKSRLQSTPFRERVTNRSPDALGAGSTAGRLPDLLNQRCFGLPQGDHLLGVRTAGVSNNHDHFQITVGRGFLVRTVKSPDGGSGLIKSGVASRK